MKYISLIIICTLLLGASGDSERPRRWRDASSEFSKRDFELLHELAEVLLQHEERYGISHADIPEELVDLKKVKQESNKILAVLTKIADNPEALKRFSNVIAHLGDPQSSEGKLFWNIIHSVLTNPEDREVFIRAQLFVARCEIQGYGKKEMWGLGHHACGLLLETAPFWPLGEKGFKALLNQFNGTKLEEDLSWLQMLLNPDLMGQKAEYDSLVKRCSSGTKRWAYSFVWELGDCAQEEKQIWSKVEEITIPEPLRNFEQYSSEIGLFIRLEKFLPSTINFAVRYAQFLAGYTVPKHAAELDFDRFKATLEALKYFLQDDENGFPAILRHAEG